MKRLQLWLPDTRINSDKTEIMTFKRQAITKPESKWIETDNHHCKQSTSKEGLIAHIEEIFDLMHETLSIGSNLT